MEGCVGEHVGSRVSTAEGEESEELSRGLAAEPLQQKEGEEGEEEEQEEEEEQQGDRRDEQEEEVRW